MKKLMFICAILLGAVVMNAQAQTPTAKSSSAPVSIKISDLPKSISENIAKSYIGYTIKEAFSLINAGKTEYKVIISKGNMNDTLLYDANGNFIKKMEAKSQAMAHSSKPAPKSGTRTSSSGKK